jgi:transaldolase
MNATRQLHDLGQSLWLDNITRTLLSDGTLARYIRDFSVTGLTSNPTIFEHAIGESRAYDEAIRARARAGKAGEALFFELALQDLSRAADLFRPVFDATGGVDGWVSLEVSPLLAHDARGTIAAASDLHARAARPNLFIKIPGTTEGLVAIEESIFNGVPINVTLLFSCAQYEAAAEAWLRGIERRVAAGLDPKVDSVASLFVSWRTVLGAGAHPQRLLWASTGTKDPKAPDTLYVEKLAAPGTVDTIPEKTLLAFADHGQVRQSLTIDGDAAEVAIGACARAGIDVDALAARLQREGADAFSASWRALLDGIGAKTRTLAKERAQ